MGLVGSSQSYESKSLMAPLVWRPVTALPNTPSRVELPEPPERIFEPARRPPTKPRVPTPAIKPVTVPRSLISGNRTEGTASWYCNYDDPNYRPSICMTKYPDGPKDDLVAAACGKLRRAMGGSERDWRNKSVAVRRTGTNELVIVVLRDWCASEDKLIDLYRDAMDRLGPSSGGYEVTVFW